MKKLLIVLGLILLVAAIAVGGVVAWRAAAGRVTNHLETHQMEHPAVQTEEFTKGDTVNVQYLVVSGMEDEATQAKINELLQDFYLWQWRVGQDDEPDLNRYEGRATYALAGDLLSVTREMIITDPANSAEPQKEFSTQTFQLSDGELFTFPLHAGQLRQAISEGKFKQVYPETPMEGAQDLLLASLEEEFIPPYYLTETSVGLYLNDADHVNSAYWLFEAAYEDLPAFAVPGNE